MAPDLVDELRRRGGVGGGRLGADIAGRSRSACSFRPAATTVRPPTARVAAVA
jgi:hypothetical protein